MRTILRARSFPRLLALLAPLVLAGCGGAYGYVDAVNTGSVEAENATDEFLLSPYAMLDFSIWPAGYAPGGGNYLPYPLDVGEAAYVGEFAVDYYDADAAIENLFDAYLETWFYVPVDPGSTTVFAAY